MKVPNSKQLKLHGNFAGTQLFASITNRQDRSHPEMILGPDQIATMKFNGNHLISETYDIVVTEQDSVVKTYERPPNKKSIAGIQYFRGEIEESRKKLSTHLNYANCVSFDQSYFLRTIGQLEIQKTLGNDFSLFTGAGFGVIQAFAGALGLDVDVLANWYVSDFKNSIKKSFGLKTGEAILKLGHDQYDNKRFNPRSARKTLRHFFRTGKRDLLVRDCKKDIFIPIQDVSGRVEVVTKQLTPNFKIYEVISACIFDPLFFKTKPEIKGFGVSNGDLAKNNNAFIREGNPTINIISVGSPVRCFDWGTDSISREQLSVHNKMEKHLADLSIEIKGHYTRHECKPIDEYHQFETKQRAMDSAWQSGDINA